MDRPILNINRIMNFTRILRGVKLSEANERKKNCEIIHKERLHVCISVRYFVLICVNSIRDGSGGYMLKCVYLFRMNLHKNAISVWNKSDDSTITTKQIGPVTNSIEKQLQELRSI